MSKYSGTNIKNGSTGQLSAVSVFSMNFRSFGRVYTYLMESGDPFRLTQYSMTSVLNSIQSFQIVYYHFKNKNLNKKNV